MKVGSDALIGRSMQENTIRKKKTLKKIKTLVVALVLTAIIAMPAFAFAGSTGNGAISGPHFTLNLLGKNWDNGDYAETLLNPVVKEDEGHRIFVKLDGKTRIALSEGDFGVLDADGTDGKAAFSLPAPGDVVDPETQEYLPDNAEYLIFIRVVGKPTGSATLTTGAYTDLEGNVWILSQESITIGQTGADVNRKSPPKFVDVTKQLTTVFYDYDADGVVERVPIFDDVYEGYFWDYDNSGIKHVQLRFYPVA